MTLLSVIGAALALALVLVKAFLDWRTSSKEADGAAQKKIDDDKKIADDAETRTRQAARKENAGAIAVEDKVDAALRGRS